MGGELDGAAAAAPPPPPPPSPRASMAMENSEGPDIATPLPIE
jgi:hypothetical protein